MNWSAFSYCNVAVALALFCYGPAFADPRLPRGCEVAEDLDQTTLVIDGDAQVIVTPQSCPVGAAAGDRFLAYALSWHKSGVREAYAYADPARPSSEGVVDVTVMRAGPSVIVIDEQAERGGDAIIIWRAAANRYFSRKHHYAGLDEGGLQVRQTGNTVRLAFIQKHGAISRMIGKATQFRLNPAKGIIG